MTQVDVSVEAARINRGERESERSVEREMRTGGERSGVESSRSAQQEKRERHTVVGWSSVQGRSGRISTACPHNGRGRGLKRSFVTMR